MAQMTKKSERPSFLCWLAAASSLLLSCLALCCASLLGAMLYQHEMQDQLKGAVRSAQADLAIESYSHLVSPPFFVRAIFAPRAGADPSAEVKTDHLRQILDMLPSLAAQDCSEALHLARELNFEKLSLGAVREQLVSCSLASQTVKQAEEDLLKLQKYLRSYPSQYHELAERFGALLSLKPARTPDGQPELAPYSAGVLKGLPQLEGLPDAIPTLSDLKERLSALDAKVQISAPNPFEEFKKLLQDFVNDTSVLTSERTRGLERIEQLKTDSAAQNSHRQRLIESILSELAQFVAQNSARFVDDTLMQLKERLDSFLLTI